MSVNQNLKPEEKQTSYDEARNGLSLRGSDGACPCYGPFRLGICLCRILFHSFAEGQLSREELSTEAVDGIIAFSNAVKCSRNVRSSTPSDTMIVQCAEFTFDEIRILAPDVILCIGRVPYDQILARAIELGCDVRPSALDIDDFTRNMRIDGRRVLIARFYHYGNQQSISTAWKVFKRLRQHVSYINDCLTRIEQTVATSVMWSDLGHDYHPLARLASSVMIEKAIVAQLLHGQEPANDRHNTPQLTSETR